MLIASLLMDFFAKRDIPQSMDELLRLVKLLEKDMEVNDVGKFIEDVVRRPQHYIHLTGNLSSLVTDLKLFGEFLIGEWLKQITKQEDPKKLNEDELKEIAQNNNIKVTFVAKRARIDNEATIEDIDDIKQILKNNQNNEFLLKLFDAKLIASCESDSTLPGTNLFEASEALTNILNKVSVNKATLGARGEHNNFTLNLANFKHFRFVLAEQADTQRFFGLMWDKDEKELPPAFIISVPKGMELAKEFHGLVRTRQSLIDFYRAFKLLKDNNSKGQSINYEAIIKTMKENDWTFVESTHPEILLLDKGLISNLEAWERYQEARPKGKSLTLWEFIKQWNKRIIDTKARKIFKELGGRYLSKTYKLSEQIARNNEEAVIKNYRKQESKKEQKIKKVSVCGFIVPLDRIRLEGGCAFDFSRGYEHRPRHRASIRTIAQKLIQAGRKPKAIFNILYSFPKEQIGDYDKQREDRPFEKLGDLNFYLDYHKFPNEDKVAMPLYKKSYFGYHESKDKFIFGRKKLDSGKLVIDRQEIRWGKEDVVDSLRKDTLEWKEIYVYTPLYSKIELKDENPEFRKYRKLIGKDRCNLIIIDNKIHAIILGEVLLSCAGIIISLNQEVFERVLKNRVKVESEKANYTAYKLNAGVEYSLEINNHDKAEWILGGDS